MIALASTQIVRPMFFVCMDCCIISWSDFHIPYDTLNYLVSGLVKKQQIEHNIYTLEYTRDNILCGYCLLIEKNILF